MRRTSKPTGDGGGDTGDAGHGRFARPPAAGSSDRRCCFERLPERLDPDPVEHVARERVDQHVARLLQVESSRPQIEDRVLVELTDRRAVRALHVVGEDLELRLRVDLRIVGEQQRLVRLLGVGLLRVGPHDDLAVEDGAGVPAQDPFVQLVAAAVRLGVVDRRVIVDQPPAVREIQAVQRAVAALAVEHGDDVVPDQRAAERDRVRRKGAVARAVHVHAADVVGVLALALQLVMIDHRAGPDHDLRDRVGEVLLSRRTDIAFDDPGLAAVAGDDQHARVRHAGGLGRCRHEQQRNGLFDDRARRDPHERAVLEEARVQRRERLPIRRSEPAEIRFHGRRVRGQDRPQTGHVHAGGQLAAGKLRRIGAVHQHEPVAAECAGPALHPIRREAALAIVRRRESTGRRSARRS